MRLNEITEGTDATPKGFAELSVVCLAREIESTEGRLTKGSVGTVVGKYDGGIGYEIEFHKPFHAVATVEVHDLEQ